MELKKHLDKLKESFINRDYEENFLTVQFNRISGITRNALLTLKPNIVNKPRIPLVKKFKINTDKH